MNSPLNSLATRIIELIGLFNQQKIDLPERLLHPDCIFRVNGRAYHEQLGRSPSDPLVRLVGCGPAGYRFVLTALRYAIEEPQFAIEEPTIEVVMTNTEVRFSAQGSLEGRLRGDRDATGAMCEITVRAGLDGWVHEIAVLMGDADVERIVQARRR